MAHNNLIVEPAAKTPMVVIFRLRVWYWQNQKVLSLFNVPKVW